MYTERNDSRWQPLKEQATVIESEFLSGRNKEHGERATLLKAGVSFFSPLWVEIAVSGVPLDLNEASKADMLVKLWTTSHAPCTAWSHRKTWWRVKQIFPLNVSSENSLETISIFTLIPKTEKSSNPLMRFSVYEYANVELLYPPPSPDWLLWSKLDNTALWSKTLFIS